MYKTNLNILVIATAMLLFGNGAYLNAQVTVGANAVPNATLDVVAANPTGLTVEGIIAPRLTGDQIQSRNTLYGNTHKGVIIYATSAVTAPTAGDKAGNITAEGYYYFDGNVWRPFSSGLKWFYMPSITIDVSENGVYIRDLYLEYRKQFDDTSNAVINSTSPKEGTVMVKSDVNAPNPFDRIYDANELYYYVIGYDAAVFSDVSVDASGKLTYTVADAGKVSFETFMNIVFVIK